MSFIPFEEGRPKRRRTLDREQIVGAALDLLNEVGLDALTMRLLAARLGVKAASLYRHIRDKRELLIHMADTLTGRIPDPDPDLPWRERALAGARDYRDALLAIRDGARLLAEAPPAGPNRLRKIELMIGLFRAAGCTPRDALRVSYHFNNLVVEYAADESRIAAMAAKQDQPPAKLTQSMNAFFASLPAGTFPNLSLAAQQDGPTNDSGLFDFGINLLLEGIATRVKVERRARRLD